MAGLPSRGSLLAAGDAPEKTRPRARAVPARRKHRRPGTLGCACHIREELVPLVEAEHQPAHVDQNRYKREAGLSRTEQRDAAVVPKRTPASAETGSRENAHCGRLVVRGNLTSRHPRVGDCFLAYNSLWCTVCWFIAERG
jgi:hypothetical protein